MRIMTYNIQSGRDAFGRLDLSKAENEIRRQAPDILALNEVRMRTRDIGNMEQAKALADALDMHFFFAKAIDYMGGEYGIALLSRYPIASAEAIPVPPLPAEKREGYYEDRVLLKAKINVSGRRLAVYVSHFGLSCAERENACALLLTEIAKEKDPAVFMGDLNMRPNDPLMKKISAVLKDTADGEEYYTHHTLSLSMKIDYIFISSALSANETRAPYSTASDHLPVIAEVTFAE